MPTLFSKIITGEIKAHVVAEDAKHLAFLDINPLVAGHTLVIPKLEVDYLFDLTEEQLADLMIFAKRVAVAIKKAVPCKKIGVSVIGLEVAHAHIHLIPMNLVSDMNFSKTKLSPSAAELMEVAENISKIFKPV